MSFDGYPTFPTYGSPYELNQCPDHSIDMASNTDGQADGSLRITPVSTMGRFLQEYESPLFKMPSFSAIDEQALHASPEYMTERRRSSPISSGSYGSSYISSGWSDRQESPHSPLMNDADIHPSPTHHTYNDGVPYAYGGHPPLEFYAAQFNNVCNMQDVQKCADQISEGAFEAAEPVQFGAYGAFAQEGYQPLQDVDDCASDVSCAVPPSEYQPLQPARSHEEELPVIRRRRTHSRSIPSPVTGSRVSKRPHASRHASFHSPTHSGDTINGANSVSGHRAFPCPLAVYGCTSSFGSKNEWKRHVNTQHMRLGFWRCDQCSAANGDRKPNDFNRKDLFVQHMRRMHPIEGPRSNPSKRSGSKSPRGAVEEPALQEAAVRCYKALRTSPQDSSCLFCEQEFHGRNTWDERMEHIGRHLENAKKERKELEDPRDWRIDELAEAWMADEQIIVQQSNKRWTLATL